MTELKRCPDCGQDKLRDQFSRNRSTTDGLQAYCKPCCYRRNRGNKAAVAARNPELAARRAAKNTARNRRWLLANPEKMREYGRRFREANPEQRRERQRQANDQIRATVLDHYGRSCACCGVTGHPTIDHIGGNGKIHRYELFGDVDRPSSIVFYRWLIKSGFPEGFQTLCRRCNASKGTGPACRLDHSKAAKATQMAELKRRVMDLESQLAALSSETPNT